MTYTCTLGTAQQLAALIVEAGTSHPGPRFVIQQLGDPTKPGAPGPWRLRVQWADESRMLCSTRDVAHAREFTTVEAAINAAKKIAATAGHEQDHRWTGEAHRLAAMPEINVELL